MIVLEKHLSARHLRFLKLLHDPAATVCVGLSIGADLARWGYVRETKASRYAITEKGRLAVENKSSARAPAQCVDD